MSESQRPKVIHRVHHECHFTQIANSIIRDERLSWKARGIMCFVFSYRDEWQTSQRNIEQCGPDGREAVRSAYRELEAAGYVSFERIRESGKMVGAMWHYYESPIPEAKRTNATKWMDHTTASRTTGNPGHREPGTPGTRTTTEDCSTEDHVTEHSEASPLPLGIQQEAGHIKVDLQKTSNNSSRPSARPKKPRPRDPIFDAMVMACYQHGETEKVTDGQAGWIGKAISQLKAVQPDLTPEMILQFARQRKKEWPQGSVTPGTFINYWRPPAASGGMLPESTLTEVEAKIRACRGFHHHIDHEKATEEEHAEYARLMAKRRTML